MQQVSFALDIDHGWPPVAVEHVWCEQSDSGGHELRSVPFFIAGLAVGDRFLATPDPVNGLIFGHEVVEPSGHSLVWILDNADIGFEPTREYLESLGCKIETFARFRLHAVDVPFTVDRLTIQVATRQLERVGFSVALPVWRHGDEDAM